jgi:hypothetical protein
MSEMEMMWELAEDDIKQAYGRTHLEGQFAGLHKALETCSPTMTPVLDALEDALVNEKPSVRYLVDGGRGIIDWYNVSTKLESGSLTKTMLLQAL